MGERDGLSIKEKRLGLLRKKGRGGVKRERLSKEKRKRRVRHHCLEKGLISQEKRLTGRKEKTNDSKRKKGMSSLSRKGGLQSSAREGRKRGYPRSAHMRRKNRKKGKEGNPGQAFSGKKESTPDETKEKERGRRCR